MEPDRETTEGQELEALFGAFAQERAVRPALSLEEWITEQPDLPADVGQALCALRNDVSSLALRLVAEDEDSAREERSPGLSSMDTGEDIGPYQLEAFLGRGGMGEVWQARDRRTGEPVALKLLHPSRYDSKNLERFAREARAGGQLDHPGVVKTLGHGRDGGWAWIALEFVPGSRTLADAIEETARADDFDHAWYEKSAIWAGELAQALAVVHAAGLLHRDLKPSNVLLTPEGRTKLADFGLAAAQDDVRLTTSGERIGTIAYMSPEQVRGEPLDERTDVHGLGAVLYELLALHRAFTGDSSEALAQRIRSEEPADPALERAGLPRPLATIARKALRLDRRKRYSSAEEMAADLERFLVGEPIRARPPSSLDRALHWTRRNPGKSSASGVLLVAFIAIALLLIDNVRANGRLHSMTESAEHRRAEVFRLKALQAVEDMTAEADGLWPVVPGKIEAYESWIHRARALVDELPVHIAKRDELRAKALPQSRAEAEADRRSHPAFWRWSALEKLVFETETRAAGAPTEGNEREAEQALAKLEGERAALDALLSERRDWRFPDNEPEARWWNTQLTKLISGLEALQNSLLADDVTTPEHGWSIPKRLDMARSLEVSSRPGGPLEQAWTEALPRILAAYPGLKSMSPQLGLVPLGQDPDSSLWEFAHLASGDAPTRAENGTLSIDGRSGLVLVLLRGGTSSRGAQNADPHGENYDPDARENEWLVTRTDHPPFFLSKYEMTQGQWQRLTGANPSLYSEPFWRSAAAIHPVETVAWAACRTVCERAGLSLPTEDQWEYGARGGTTSVWWTGNVRESLRGAANLADQTAARQKMQSSDVADWPDLDDGFGPHAPVNAYRPNPFGLHNVHGNVWEWCLELSAPPFVIGGVPTEDPVAGSLGVIRGGSFYESALKARSAMRHVVGATARDNTLGLRPARALDP